MTRRVTVLGVVSTNRGAYAAEDIVDGLLWSCTTEAAMIVVDTKNSIPRRTRDNYTLLRISAAADQGFHRAQAVKWAIDQGIVFDYAVLLDDTSMVTGKGLDAWLLEKLRREPQLGVFGAHDRNSYEDAYPRCVPLLAEWSLPHTSLAELPRYVLHGGMIAMSGTAARRLYEHDALSPPGVERWPITFGPYISWVTQMFGYFQLGGGSQDKQMPPLYVGLGRNQPPPHILSPQFLLYHGANTAAGYSEEELREVFKRFRGDPNAKPQIPLQPVVSGIGASGIAD